MLYAVLFIHPVCKYAGVGAGNLFLFGREGKEGREKLFCSLGLWCWLSGLQMCFFLCGGLCYLFSKAQRKNVNPYRYNWTPQCFNIKLQRKNIIQHHKNIKLQHNNWTLHRANIKLHHKNIKLHCWNVTLHWKNVKTSRSNIIFGW